MVVVLLLQTALMLLAIGAAVWLIGGWWQRFKNSSSH